MTPDVYTLKERMINVSDDHRLYVQLWGSQTPTETFIFLHGGPGSGCNDGYKAYFDPTKHQVAFFDQRGCGKSLPHGSIEANDTDRLMVDINTIADECGLQSFSLTGGSWGSCLALAYGIQYPERVSRMVLRGVFTGRQQEIDFVDKGGVKSFFPELWEAFVASASPEFANNPSAYHLPRVLSNDAEAAKQSAYAYSCLQGGVMRLDDRTHPYEYETFDPASTIIECHYLSNACFMPDGHILQNAHKLTMPIHLVQGRYDAVCPPITAYQLSKVLPNATLTWTTAGHSGNDRATWDVTRTIIGTFA